MKKTKSLFAIFAMSALAAICGFAQAPDRPANPKYDAELARKTGADDYGMRKYVFCVLKTGPKDAAIKDKAERDQIFGGHMANIKRLAGEGKLALAGPFGTNEKGYRGIFIFAVETVEEAQKLVDTDPVIRSGMMIADLTPWYGSAATMLINDAHEKVGKKSF